MVVVFILRPANWTFIVCPFFPSHHLSAASEMAGCKLEDESGFPQWSLLLGDLHCLPVEGVPLVIGDGVTLLGLPVVSGSFVIDELVDSCFCERGKLLPSDPESPSFVMQLEVGWSVAFGPFQVSLGCGIHPHILKSPPVQPADWFTFVILVSFYPSKFHLDGKSFQAFLAVQQQVEMWVFGGGGGVVVGVS